MWLCCAEELLADAGPGGPYSRTLLLVMGDHGQTLTGDHGGGSAEEVDTVMVAFHLGRWRAARDERAEQEQQLQEQQLEQHQEQQQEKGPRQEQQEQRPLQQRQQADREGEEGGEVGQGAGGQHDGAVATGVPGVEAVRPERMLQNDLTPTWALLLGLPVPFGNLGAVNRRLWELGWPGHGAGPTPEAAAVGNAAETVAAGADARGDGGGQDSAQQQGHRFRPMRMRAMGYVEALHSNAIQVGADPWDIGKFPVSGTWRRRTHAFPGAQHMCIEAYCTTPLDSLRTLSCCCFTYHRSTMDLHRLHHLPCRWTCTCGPTPQPPAAPSPPATWWRCISCWTGPGRPGSG